MNENNILNNDESRMECDDSELKFNNIHNRDEQSQSSLNQTEENSNLM